MKSLKINFDKEQNKELINILKVVSLIPSEKLDATNIALLSGVLGVESASISQITDVLKEVESNLAPTEVPKAGTAENPEGGDKAPETLEFGKTNIKQKLLAIAINKVDKKNYSLDEDKIIDAIEIVKVIDQDVLECPEAFKSAVSTISDAFNLPTNVITSLIEIKKGDKAEPEVPEAPATPVTAPEDPLISKQRLDNYNKFLEQRKIAEELNKKVINFAKSIYFEGISKSKLVSFLKGCSNFSGNAELEASKIIEEMENTK